ncbi:MAG TPA: CBS domain-containing protein [Thermodesulfovibrionales bacterium]|nr:CBS domain-containing protein [Thermodesulfovibrionales bacterium]
MRVCDLMHKGVISCYADDTVKDVARIMENNHFRSVVVVNERGEVWGLITYMEMIPHYGRNLEGIRACDIMRPYRVEIDPQWPIENAIEVMKKFRYYHLIIVDPHVGTKWPVGMLTSFDVVRYMARLEAGQFEQLLKISG